MVTHSELFQFTTTLITLASFIYLVCHNNKKKK